MIAKPESKINRSGLTFTDKVVIITGGAKGIGEGCARVFVDAGARTVLLDKDPDAGRALEQDLNSKGPGSCHLEVGDVNQPEDLQRLVSKALELHGCLDCLVNNAGYHPPVKPIDEFTIEEFEDVLRTNLIAYFAACKYALPHLRKTRGSIVNISSLVGSMGQEGATTYTATKGAVNALTKSLAIEEARFGVRVNAVLPSNILSHGRIEAIAAMEDPEYWDTWIDYNQHNGRSGTPEEVGQLCLFLASDAATFLTGLEMNISFGAELGYGIKYPLVFLEDEVGDKMRWRLQTSE